MTLVEKEEPTTHILQRWISMGDILVLLFSALGLAVSYGKLSSDLASVTREVRDLQNRDITPGARSALSAITARDEAQDDQIADVRLELREQRREMIERLARIETALSDHDRVQR